MLPNTKAVAQQILALPNARVRTQLRGSESVYMYRSPNAMRERVYQAPMVLTVLAGTPVNVAKRTIVPDYQ